MFFRTPFFIPWLYPRLIWRMPTPDKELYLTFDDGPVPGITEFVLDTLNTFSSKATFFCIGDNIRKHPDIFQKIISEGHRIGNHTFHHVNGWRTSWQEYRTEIDLCESEINRHVEPPVKLFRPPYGKLKRDHARRLPEYKIVMWDVLSYDFDKALSKEVCLQKVINCSRNGSVIVFHDSYKAEEKVRFVLPRILEHFIGQGYVFKSIAG